MAVLIIQLVVVGEQVSHIVEMAVKVLVGKARRQNHPSLHFHVLAGHLCHLFREHWEPFVVADEAAHLELETKHFFAEKLHQKVVWDLALNTAKTEKHRNHGRVFAKLFELNKFLEQFFCIRFVVRNV